MKDNCWGKSLHLDLYGCDGLLITSRGYIKNYVVSITDKIKMKRYKNTMIEWFGEEEHVKGFSFIQLIYTSSITGHFSEEKGNGYIDIFSCKEFDEYEATKFTKDYFNAEEYMMNVLYRK
jgi:S-adenosylmethionine/arginine decarboxylase-like enzyme